VDDSISRTTSTPPRPAARGGRSGSAPAASVTNSNAPFAAEVQPSVSNLVARVPPVSDLVALAGRNRGRCQIDEEDGMTWHDELLAGQPANKSGQQIQLRRGFFPCANPRKSIAAAMSCLAQARPIVAASFPLG
jgi:hypothetical protein